MISEIVVDTLGDEPFTIETPDDELQLVMSVSAQGPPGSQELRVNEVASATNTVIDYAKGSWQHLTLVGNVNSLSVSNWPPSGKAARLVLQITNTGSFAINGWPPGTLWPNGAPPIITPGAGKQDLVVLSSGSGGSPIFGSVAGQDFS